MAKQERMIESLGEGWKDTGLDGVVTNGWVQVLQTHEGGYRACFRCPASDEPRDDLAPLTNTMPEPRDAVDALFARAYQRHEERAKVLQQAETARGWVES